MQIKETIDYLCKILNYFGIKCCQAETFRKAKYNDPLIVINIFIKLIKI